MTYTTTRYPPAQPHRCELPKVRWPYKERNRGWRVKCDNCGVEYEWTHFGYSDVWDWEKVE